MTDGEKTSKLKEIKEIVSCAVKIMHQISLPDIQESFGNVINTAKIAKEIIEVLKTPEMVKNIENFRFISENMSETSTRIQNILKQLEDTGVMSEAKGLIKSSKSTVDSFNGSGQDLHEINVAVKEMFKSIRTFVDELKITAVS